MSKQSLSAFNDDNVLLCGYYKKLKTMKKKFFVLYNETPCKVARIEYYDNEKKYKSGFTPKRIIKIKDCFNINRRLYTKHDFVIVLASKEGAFGIVMDSEGEMNTWLNHLIHLQRSGEPCFDFPKFDYVWQVIIQKKGVAEQHNIFGNHHICLTNKSVTFIKIGRDKIVGEKKIIKIDVLLTTIRRCGDSQCYFYMEIGRQSSLGPGELWMETEDSLTAQNMHRMILSKMVALNESQVEPMRKRSSSATEATNLHHNRKSSQNIDDTSNYLYNAQNFSRDRCDSLPSRSRTSSECSSRIIPMVPTTSAHRVINIQISNPSSIGYSASEESVSVDDSEESIGMPYSISSRSPEDIIPEEYIIDASPPLKDNADINSVNIPSMDPVSTANMPLVKKYSAVKSSDIKKDICGNIDDQQHFSTQICSLVCKCEKDMTKDITVNRVRAFSVGSRFKNNAIYSKANLKLFNNESVNSPTRKSISVPVLINKNLQSSNDQMGDLMEIDFSKPISRTLNRNFHHDQNDFRNTSNVLTKNLNISNSEESIRKSIKKIDNGYLEMKPITTFETNNVTSNGNNPINNKILHSQNQFNLKQEENKIYSAAFTETLNDKGSGPDIKDINYPDLSDIDSRITKTKDAKFKSAATKSIFSSMSSKNSNGNKLSQLNETGITEDLYYASLDLPKCGNEVNNRYGFQDGLSDTNIEEIKNEYAKINFVQPDTSRK